ncbi:hypothetical protein KCP74_14220 [Salmonella enterica subsp. enterica]|nr:hypothetical protein KCP74_14220 [Salmonella enterica subsp. enterica]
MRIIVTGGGYLLVTGTEQPMSSMRVNENLDINPARYLDINHADIVARIDLTEWETGRNRPATGVPERSG